MKNYDKLLEEFMFTFYGYGNLESNYWFIGMEEGGDASKNEVITRIEAWEKMGKGCLLDIYEFHREINRIRHFGKNAPSQRTWSGLIKILQSIKSEQIQSLQEIKRYQSEELGRSHSETCLLEVFPLPSPNTKEFNHSEWTNIEYLKTRQKYKAHLASERIKKLNGLIIQYKPKFVIFYSSTPEYIEYWSKISGVKFEDVEKEVIIGTGKKDLKAQFKYNNDTCFAVTHHPTYLGISGDYLQQIGQRMKMEYNEGC